MLKTLRSILKPVSLTRLAHQPGISEKIRFCIAAYYFVTPYLAYLFLANRLDGKPRFEAFGPLSWTNWFDLTNTEIILAGKVCFVLIALLAAGWHQHRWVRIAFFIMIVHIHALESSYGSVNHQWYTWMYTSGILIFLPNIWQAIDVKQTRRALLVIWTATAFILLTYTMAGIHKFIYAGYQWYIGEIHGLARDAFLYQTTWWAPRLQSPTYIIEYIEAYPYISWFFYVSLHFVQLFAFWCVIRVRLLFPATLLLIAFHGGVVLSMGITFAQHTLLLCAFLLTSPLVIRPITWRELYFDLPIIGWATVRFVRTYKKCAPYLTPRQH